MKNKSSKRLKVILLLTLVIFFVSHSSALEVKSNSHSITIAQGGSNLSVYSSTHTQISTGIKANEVLSNANAYNTASGANYFLSKLTTKITIYNESGIVKKMETYSSTSTSLPKSFTGYQKLNNLIDTWNSNTADLIIENVIKIGNNEYIFETENLIPLDNPAVIRPPSYPKHFNVEGSSITFGTGFLNTVEGDGIEYSGGFGIKTTISLDWGV